MGTADNRVDLLYGTLDLLVLRTLVYGPSHGHAIARHIQRVWAHSRFPGHALTPTGVMAIRCKQFHLPDL